MTSLTEEEREELGEEYWLLFEAAHPISIPIQLECDFVMEVDDDGDGEIYLYYTDTWYDKVTEAAEKTPEYLAKTQELTQRVNNFRKRVEKLAADKGVMTEEIWKEISGWGA